MDWIHHRSLCLLKAFSSSQNFIFCWLLMSSLFHLQELTKYYQLLRKVALFLNRVLLVHLSWTGSKHLPCRKIQQCMRDLCHIHPTIIFLRLFFFFSEILLQWLKPLLHTVLRIQITKLPSNTLKMDHPNSKWQSLYIISSIFFCKSFIWRDIYIYLLISEALKAGPHIALHGKFNNSSELFKTIKKGLGKYHRESLFENKPAANLEQTNIIARPLTSLKPLVFFLFSVITVKLIDMFWDLNDDQSSFQQFYWQKVPSLEIFYFKAVFITLPSWMEECKVMVTSCISLTDRKLTQPNKPTYRAQKASSDDTKENERDYKNTYFWKGVSPPRL